MSLKRITRLAASAGVTAGLALGGLATVGTTAADAATSTATATYTCTNPLGVPASTFQVPATLSLDTLDDALVANVPVPGGLPFTTTLDFSATGLIPSLLFTLNSAVTTVLGQAGLGALSPQVTSAFTQISNGSAIITSQLGSFVPTSSGSLPLPIPTSLNFGLLTGVLGGLGINCTLNPGSVTGGGGNGSVGAFTVVKQGSKIKAHAKKKGAKTVLTVKVKTSAGQKGIGSIIAKAKGAKAKTKALSNGKVKIVLKKLKQGKSKVKLSYSGNSFTNPAKKNIRVRR